MRTCLFIFSILMSFSSIAQQTFRTGTVIYSVDGVQSVLAPYSPIENSYLLVKEDQIFVNKVIESSLSDDYLFTQLSRNIPRIFKTSEPQVLFEDFENREIVMKAYYRASGVYYFYFLSLKVEGNTIHFLADEFTWPVSESHYPRFIPVVYSSLRLSRWLIKSQVEDLEKNFQELVLEIRRRVNPVS